MPGSHEDGIGISVCPSEGFSQGVKKTENFAEILPMSRTFPVVICEIWLLTDSIVQIK